MLVFKALLGSLNVVALNIRLKEFCDYSNSLDARIKALEGGKVETISDSPVIEAVTVTVDAAQPFNYLDCDDLDQLKAFADENDVSYDARATISSLQKKITIKLGVAE